MLASILEFVNVLCIGLLAVEEFVICYGVGAPIASLDEKPHLRLRQVPVRTLRIVVPTIFGLSFISGAAAAIPSRGLGSELRNFGLVIHLDNGRRHRADQPSRFEMGCRGAPSQLENRVER